MVDRRTSCMEFMDRRGVMRKEHKLFDRSILIPAILGAVKKLNSKHQIKNQFLFVVWVGSLLTTVLFLSTFARPFANASGGEPAGFILSVSLWLWFTVLFANFAEAMAEGRGKAQAANLRKARQDTPAKKLLDG